MTLVLETTRLLLRPFRDADLPDFVAYRSDPDVARWQGWSTPYSLQQGAEFLQEMAQVQPATPGRWCQLAMERRADGVLLGDCAFKIGAHDSRQAEIGMTVARAHQRSGYATEAGRRLLDYLFGELGLHRVRAGCDVENVPVIRLLEAAGLRREAHLIEAVWFKGGWSSEYWYALLRREWLAR